MSWFIAILLINAAIASSQLEQNFKFRIRSCIEPAEQALIASTIKAVNLINNLCKYPCT